MLRRFLAGGSVSERAVSFAQLVVKHKGRFVRFSLVGASGVLVNTTMLYVLIEAGGLNPVIAAVFATEAAILSNFSLNDVWTFRDVKVERSWVRRAFRYNCGAFGGLLISVGVLALFTHAIGLHYLVANLFAIGASMGWNYTVSYLYTWATPGLGKSAIERTSPTTLLRRKRFIVRATILLSLIGIAAGFNSTLVYLHGWVVVGPGLAILALGALLPLAWAAQGLGKSAIERTSPTTLLRRKRFVIGATVMLALTGFTAGSTSTLVYLHGWVVAERLGLALLALGALLLFAQSLFSLYLMLYTWEDPDRLEASKGPESFLPPQSSFTVLLPARHEEAVIFDTIHRVWSANYPSELLEVVVVCHADDEGTIAEAGRAIGEIGSPRVRVETFSEEPINKPHGLNVGLQRTGNRVVTIFDAEDDIDPDIFNVVNTIMLEEGTGIVQGGVQLMNLRDRWFSVHNVLEYFFYFKSRLHYHARVGMIPLGGNTVFIRRDLMERVGEWDEGCLTEDADIGLRLSVLGESIRVVYDAQHVTREETPDSIGSFIRQRTRWSQGFLQVLRKGTWLSLNRPGRKLLACYTFSLPLLQASLTLLWPPALFALLWLRVPVAVAMISFLPLYALVLQLLVNAIGVCVFMREYKLRFSPLTLATMVLTFFPYQWVLGISALRAFYRELRNQKNWEKTSHLGAHRQPATTFVPDYELLLEEILSPIASSVDRASLVLRDPAEQTYSIKASKGLSADVVAYTKIKDDEGVTGWVARKGKPMVINGKEIPGELRLRLRQPELLSSIVIPFEDANGTHAVLSLSSRRSILSDIDLQKVKRRVRSLSAASERGPASRGAASLRATSTLADRKP